jgi:hypothetical protein
MIAPTNKPTMPQRMKPPIAPMKITAIGTWTPPPRSHGP